MNYFPLTVSVVFRPTSQTIVVWSWNTTFTCTEEKISHLQDFILQTDFTANTKIRVLLHMLYFDHSSSLWEFLENSFSYIPSKKTQNYHQIHSLLLALMFKRMGYRQSVIGTYVRLCLFYPQFLVSYIIHDRKLEQVHNVDSIRHKLSWILSKYILLFYRNIFTTVVFIS